MHLDAPDHEWVKVVGRIPVVPSILDVACRLTGMGCAIVARVTEDRWTACSVLDAAEFGLQPGGELKIETTFCLKVKRSGEPVIINDAANDPTYCDHPSPVAYGFQSYISMPIVMPNGSFFGTLCALDPKPRMIETPEVIGAFRLFAELIALHLDANLRLADVETSLARERETSELREQFIAVLGHDLRNPLAAVSAGARMLARHPDRADELVGRIDRSISRMSGLIDDVLDFARGRLGGGLTVDRAPAAQIEPVLRQVVEELRSTHPDRDVDVALSLDQPICCDAPRIGQLLSNLLANALTHGSPEKPITVRASTAAGTFTLAVANAGEPIPPETMDSLFKPFFRGAARPSQQGLGLGLFIASEIARAHKGRLDVESTSRETRFTLYMPLCA